MNSHPDIEQILHNFDDYEDQQLIELFLALKEKLSRNGEDRYSFGLTREGNRLLYFVLSRKSTIAGHNTLSDVIFSSQESVISPKIWNSFDDVERDAFSRISAYVREVNRQLDQHLQPAQQNSQGSSVSVPAL